MPGNATDKIDNNAYPIRTKVASISKYSAIPPHTPAILWSNDLLSFLLIIDRI